MSDWIRTRGIMVGSLLMLACLAIFLPGLSRPLASREQELRVVVTARNMVELREWLIPRYRDELRARKPPLMYWVVGTACVLGGTTDSDFIMRLPTVLFGTALLGLVFAGGRLLIGPRRALLGAIVAGTSLIFLRFTRLAETDIPQAFLVTATFFSLYCALRSSTPGRWWILSGTCAGLGCLVKSPAALILPLAALLILPLLPPRRPYAWRWRGLAAVLVPLLLIVLPWYLFILQHDTTRSASAAQIGTEVDALFLATQHPGPIAYYLYTMVYLLLPWGLILIPAGIALWQAGRLHFGTRFLLAWLLSSVVVLSLIPSKQEQYGTLLVTPCCLAIGFFLPRGWRAQADWQSKAVQIGLAIPWGLLALMGVGLLVGPWLPMFPRPHESRFYEWMGGVILGVAALSVVVPWGQSAVRRFAAVALMMIAVNYVVTLDLHEVLLPSTTYRTFVDQARRQLPAGTRVVCVGHAHSSLEFYLHRTMESARTFEEAWAMTVPGDGIVVSSKGDGQPVFPDPVRYPPRLLEKAPKAVLGLYVRTPSTLDQR